MGSRKRSISHSQVLILLCRKLGFHCAERDASPLVNAQSGSQKHRFCALRMRGGECGAGSFGVPKLMFAERSSCGSRERHEVQL